jgi:branched-chain amino acid aminotransferase
VIQVAQNELGLEVSERHIDRSQIYVADECFLTGTAANLTPVVEVDYRKIGDGTEGPISARLRELYFEIVVGKNPKYLQWCTAASPRAVSV